MTLKQKIFFLALLSGMIPLLVLFFFHQVGLDSLEARIEKELIQSANMLEEVQENNQKAGNEHKELHISIGQIANNFSQLEQNTRALLETEFHALNEEIKIRFEKQGKLVADLVENFIKHTILEKLQNDIKKEALYYQRKKFQSFLQSLFPDNISAQEKFKSTFQMDKEFIRPFFEEYIDDKLIQSVEKMGYKLAVYIDGSIKSSSFKNEQGQFIPMPHAANLEIEAAYEKILGHQCFLTYRELKDTAGFEVGRLIIVIDIEAFMKSKNQRESRFDAMKKSFSRLVEKQESIKQKAASTSIAICSCFKDQEKAIQKMLQLFNFSLKGMKDYSQKMFQVSLYVFFSSLLLMTVFAGYMSFFVVKPIQTIGFRLKDIAKGQGDLTRRIEVNRKDEIGEVAKWFNIFVESLHEIIVSIVQYTHTLSAASQELAFLSKEISRAADDMQIGAGSVALVSEEVSVSVAAVASSAEESSRSVFNIAGITDKVTDAFIQVSQLSQKTATNVKQNAKASNDISKKTKMLTARLKDMSISLNTVAKHTAQANIMSQKAVRGSQEMNQKISGLITASKQIGKGLGAIKKITDQTQMLALNATIEAANAGQAGKGFSVVAGEVKALANQSAEVTEELSEYIDQIKLHVEQAVKTIDYISKIIKEIADINESIAVSLGQQSANADEISESVIGNTEDIILISKNSNESAQWVSEIALSANKTSKSAKETAMLIDELAKGVKDVALSSSQAAQGVQDISKNIQNIREASKKTAVGAGQTQSSSEELAKLSASLAEIVKRFKL